MKIEHEGTAYIDAATHAGLRCWLGEHIVEALEKVGGAGDYAKDELIRYLVDPDGYVRMVKASGYELGRDLLITDADDHRIHWPLRNTHRHPLADTERAERAGADQPEGTPVEGGFDSRRSTKPEHTGKGTSGKTVELGEWPKYARLKDGMALYRATSADACLDGCEPEDGCWRPVSCRSRWSAVGPLEHVHEITPTEAAKWLREHGHEEAAAEIDDPYEPVDQQPLKGDTVININTGERAKVVRDGHWFGNDEWVADVSSHSGWIVGPKTEHRILKRKPAEIDALPESLRGARVFEHGNGNMTLWCPSMSRLETTFLRQGDAWVRRGWCLSWNERPEPTFAKPPELHGPEREEVLRDFAASAAFREWEARA